MRLHALLEALRHGPQELSELLAQIGSAYPEAASARCMIDRDLVHLATLGITVERGSSPPTYTLRGGAPVFAPAELRTLALIRDSFDARHPQAAQVATLLSRLTASLTERERRDYDRRAARRARVRPAIDYTAYADVIEQLEQSIAVRHPVRFRYLPTSGRERVHLHVEP